MPVTILPSGGRYHEPPYTQAEIDDFYRRVSTIRTVAGPARPARTDRPEAGTSEPPRSTAEQPAPPAAPLEDD